ncbi:hypothetical protein HZ326_6414 [Fusarium oxysporum f. sp. albedinis]|nr:hypothetical protein HZ326_6414 [Fusarium oxysporum f. sp. albedinis]
MENAPLGTCIVVMLDFPHEASDRQVPIPEMRICTCGHAVKVLTPPGKQSPIVRSICFRPGQSVDVGRFQLDELNVLDPWTLLLGCSTQRGNTY